MFVELAPKAAEKPNVLPPIVELSEPTTVLGSLMPAP
jgi:hypothetical protein